MFLLYFKLLLLIKIMPFSLGWVVTMGGVGYRFYRVVFVKEFVLGGDVNFGGYCPQRCFIGCLFSGVLPMYDAFCLYAQFHRSLFVLSMNLVV
jgi:hypothetical protein